MPLPDERPRQSVANLIGRFENQIQRQPPSTSPPSRSTSVNSDISGDAAKEESKEKREWPPKSVVINASSPPIFSSPSWIRSKAPEPVASTEPPMTESPTIEEVPLTPRPASTTSVPDANKTQQQLSVGVNTNITITTTTPTPTTPKAVRPTIAKTPAAPASTLAKPSSKFASKSSANHVIATPLRPQHTGPASLSSTRKTAAKLSQGTPVKPSVKAPPPSARPKTPATGSRPKTPSSGLFAPTAASLARSRNAQPQVQSPPKKVVKSSDAALERLSKPTAASLSKARTPAVVSATPLKSSTSRGGNSGTPAKATGKTAGPPSVSRIKKDASSTPQTAKEPEDVASSCVAVVTEGGTGTDATTTLAEEYVANNAEHSAVGENATAVSPGMSVHENGNTAVGETPATEMLGQERNHADAAEEAELGRGPPESHCDKVQPGDEGVVEPPPNVDAPDVNLLESTTITRSRLQSIATIPDEVIDE